MLFSQASWLQNLFLRQPGQRLQLQSLLGMTEGHVNMTSQSLMGRSVHGKPGYVAEERVTASDDGL